MIAFRKRHLSLIDQPGVNDNLDFVLLDTVRAVEQLRQEGRTVLIHCVQAQSRTATIAALYGARLRGISIAEALADVCAVLLLPNTDPIPDFREALRRLHQGAHETGMTKEIHSVRQSTAEASSAGAVVGKHLYVIEAQLPQAF